MEQTIETVNRLTAKFIEEVKSGLIEYSDNIDRCIKNYYKDSIVLDYRTRVYPFDYGNQFDVYVRTDVHLLAEQKDMNKSCFLFNIKIFFFYNWILITIFNNRFLLNISLSIIIDI